MRELNLDRLRTLVAIVDLGSFAAAARALHLAPPTVSLHISELESRIGATLLLRQRGQVRPSGVGETLVARARQLLADAEQALEEVKRQVLGLEGRVRLGASTGAIAYLLPQALERVGQSHPGIDVQVMVLTSEETLARLSGGGLDIGLVALPQAAVDGLSVKPWRRDPVMAFVPAGWDAPRTITPQWLAAQPLILNAPNTRLSRLTTEWFAAAGEHPTARIQLNFNDAVKSLVAAGYGATLLPHEAGEQAGMPPADPRIAMRPLKPRLWRPLGIAHRAGQPEPATQYVLDALWELKQLK
ncbi:LysR family transcriptional regulator [Herbaspirillum sp. LeCh32-8]|uniref:LysR family transcriptional regulator n=1 Tax=Herbaspirillum sp. LeCh32-8 TaxID=2821356 RepID=UPI001AEA6036|nr:LysR family transcriptional regulator [Herbaspirillum sp. LeCh32-8]MBP0599530.1 LysR family transcriptional regulator [Herbaspirillum sp. LeCh32-8]